MIPKKELYGAFLGLLGEKGTEMSKGISCSFPFVPKYKWVCSLSNSGYVNLSDLFHLLKGVMLP